MTDAILEAAARALKDSLGSTLLPKTYQELAEVAVAAVTPLIRAEVLEEAAQRVEDEDLRYSWTGDPRTFIYSRELAAVIRALKEQP